MSDQLIVISNRLPVTVSVVDGEYKYKMSSGGLVTALQGLFKQMKFKWIGWPGFSVDSLEEQEKIKRGLKELGCVPVFLDSKIADDHYNGFSNSILWPLFHYHPGEIQFNEQYWDSYQTANRVFAQVVCEQVSQGSYVWIHDYHLMLLPKILRQMVPFDIKTGFFLHTPFPSSEIYRILPVRKEILLGLVTTPNGCEYENRNVHIGTFPIGIDPAKFIDGLANETIVQKIEKLKKRYQGVKVIVGVDRLDYIKGVPQKLLAFELFLKKYPEWRDKVVLIQIAVPSREDVEEYQHLRQVVNELVGRINSHFSTLEFTPLHFLHTSLGFEDLVSLYAVADVCIVSSTRDGMNLVSYEYISTQRDNHGVLILSEFAGAAQSLNGSIIVNPWNTQELSNAIYEAVEMDKTTRELNHKKLFRYVTKYTAMFWGTSFVNELKKVTREQTNRHTPKLTKGELVKIVRDCCEHAVVKSEKVTNEERVVVMVDYEEILSTNGLEFSSRPPNTVILNLLTSLSKLNTKGIRFYVYVYSGRSRSFLEKWITDLGICAEYGCFVRHPAQDLEPEPEPVHSDHLGVPGSLGLHHSSSSASTSSLAFNDGWVSLVEVDPSWRDSIQPLFQHYYERTPGSYIEVQEVNLRWCYKNADPEFGLWQATELQMSLEKLVAHLPVSVIHSFKSVEVRPVDKLTCLKHIYRQVEPCLMVCIGDGYDSFGANGKEPKSPIVQSSSETGKEKCKIVTCTVGKKRTEASWFVESVEEVEQLVAGVVEYAK